MRSKAGSAAANLEAEQMSSKAFLPDSKYAAARASSRQLQTLFSEATSAAEQLLADLSRSIWGSHAHA